MSSSEASSSQGQQTSTFAELASLYRVFYLEDILAEPQELIHDPYRQVIYISQRCLEGHATSPVEYAMHISVLDASTGSASFSYINIGPYGGPHGMEIDETGAYLYIDIENDGEGHKGTVCVDLSSQTVTGFTPSSGQRPIPTNTREFVAEVDLESGKIAHKMDVPKTGRSSTRNLGTGRFVNFPTPALRFTRQSPEDGSYILEAVADPLVEFLRGVLTVPTIYVVSRNVLLI
ncbi:hypothetical protein CONLIGDRAFT_683261 [Coniochaeta ligniaria NRRL 30616]|uniref:Uncharacterized protein n=1 Tax=Coniochaeta ligniaria NRRL 30616 TaxID=1408157 RepID=A0A1J7IFN2_9PEZI|nr:hypothetical protein CONLIGDRAFT_683261 [Coniochaeta ligniaria NRRL 30616]